MPSFALSLCSNVFGFVMGSITLVELMRNVVRFHLPSSKIKVLESNETETFFKKAIEDGLLIKPRFVQETERRLAMLKGRTCRLHSQSRASNATTLGKDCAELFRGTTTALEEAYQTLKTEVISSSEEGRHQPMEMDTVPESSIPSEPFSLVVNLSTATEIVHPYSYHPSRSTWGTHQSGSAFAREDPFDDPTQTDTDVQTVNAHHCASTEYTSVNLEHDA